MDNACLKVLFAEGGVCCEGKRPANRHDSSLLSQVHQHLSLQCVSHVGFALKHFSPAPADQVSMDTVFFLPSSSLGLIRSRLKNE